MSGEKMASTLSEPVVQPEENAHPEVTLENMSREQLQALVERVTGAMLGKTPDEAFALLDRGDLDGTAVAGELRMLRRLLGAP